MTRRIQIFVEGGWFGLDEFADLVVAAVENAITDNGEGEDERPISVLDRARVLDAIMAKIAP